MQNSSVSTTIKRPLNKLATASFVLCLPILLAMVFHFNFVNPLITLGIGLLSGIFGIIALILIFIQKQRGVFFTILPIFLGMYTLIIIWQITQFTF